MALSGNSVFQASAARTNRQAARDVRSQRAKKAAAAKKPAPTSKAPAAKKTTAAKSAAGSSAKKTASKSVAKKAASAIPVGRAASIGYGAGHKIGAKLRTGGGALSSGNPRRTLVAEFLICFIVLGGAAIVAPQGEQSGIPRLMSKGTGLALLFLCLSLLSAGGQKAAKAANGLGALITAGYLFTSPDAANILKWITGFYGANGGRIAAAGEVGNSGGSVSAGVDALTPGIDQIISDILIAQDTGSGVAQGGAAGAGGGAPQQPSNPGGANKTGLQP